MTTLTPEQNTRLTIERLLNGQAPNGITPEDCGIHAPVIRELFRAYHTGADKEAMHRMYRAALLAEQRENGKRQGPLNTLMSAPEDKTTHRKLISADELGDIPDTIWLVDRVIATLKITQIFAPGGTGKSLVALDMAACVAQHYVVVYVAAEAIEDYKERLPAWREHYQRPHGKLHFWSEPVALGNDIAVEDFIQSVRVLRPALIVIDPLASCLVGLNGSATEGMTTAVDALNRIIRATGAGILLVHHTGWNETRERDSSVLRAACRVVMSLSQDDAGLLILKPEKINGKPPDTRFFRLIECAGSVVPIPAAKADMRNAPVSAKQIEIMEFLAMPQYETGAGFTEVERHTGMAGSTINKSFKRLIELGYATFKKERGRVLYLLTDRGETEVRKREFQNTSNDSEVKNTGTTSELQVNWMVNLKVNNETLTLPNAEFTEFTPESGLVHLKKPLKFTQFTDTSPVVHRDFTSISPLTASSLHPASLEAGVSELSDEEREKEHTIGRSLEGYE
jgi:DNA-binding MarR family transcriptional regulator